MGFALGTAPGQPSAKRAFRVRRLEVRVQDRQRGGVLMCRDDLRSLPSYAALRIWRPLPLPSAPVDYPPPGCYGKLPRTIRGCHG
jgi:hypothetical protein